MNSCIRYFKKILNDKKSEQAMYAWLRYKIWADEFICGLDNGICIHENCCGNDSWENYGCMYLKNYIDY